MSGTNQGALAAAKDPVLHAHTQHIDVLRHAVLECAARKEVLLGMLVVLWLLTLVALKTPYRRTWLWLYGLAATLTGDVDRIDAGFTLWSGTSEFRYDSALTSTRSPS